MYQLSKSSKANMLGVDERLVKVATLAITITQIDFGIPSDGGVRTAQEQNQLFLEGKSMCDGYKKLSNHQIAKGETRGKALDFFPYKDGGTSYSTESCTHVAAAFLEAASRLGIKVSWSGFWTGFKEQCHIQLEE